MRNWPRFADAPAGSPRWRSIPSSCVSARTTPSSAWCRSPRPRNARSSTRSPSRTWPPRRSHGRRRYAQGLPCLLARHGSAQPRARRMPDADLRHTGRRRVPRRARAMLVPQSRAFVLRCLASQNRVAHRLVAPPAHAPTGRIRHRRRALPHRRVSRDRVQASFAGPHRMGSR